MTSHHDVAGVVAFPLGPENWTPEMRGRALHMIYVLANSPTSEWRSKAELHEAMSEFRVFTKAAKEKTDAQSE